MIQENQKLLNQINVITDGLILFVTLPIAYFIRFHLLPHAVSSIPIADYMLLDIIFTFFQLSTFAALGLYRSFRIRSLRYEIKRLATAILVDMMALVSVLYLFHAMHYSRLTFGIYCMLSIGALSAKRHVVRRALRWARRKDFNQKYVLILGGGRAAAHYLREIRGNQDYGYRALGYLAEEPSESMEGLPYMGDLSAMERVLERYQPDEVVSAVEGEDSRHTGEIIAACDQAGVRLAIIPFFSEYMPPHPQFDYLNDIPLMNVRHIPLDNWGNAFIKRTMDIIGSAVLLILTSPLMLICAVGVRLSSPGPIFFRQERVGRDKRTFYMYKFRSMRVNAKEKTGWSGAVDDRRTPFGSFIRKFSLDELPQFWNVLKGDMSLVGPRPEVPFYVEQFKSEVPLYMVKHQVRPGITGWAQVNGLRGDTSIKERIEHDVYYIEHWSLFFDIKILFMTVFGGKFVNDERI